MNSNRPLQKLPKMKTPFLLLMFLFAVTILAIVLWIDSLPLFTVEDKTHSIKTLIRQQLYEKNNTFAANDTTAVEYPHVRTNNSILGDKLLTHTPSTAVTKAIMPIVPAKYIFTCNSRCIDFSGKIPACIGGYQKGMNSHKRPWAEQGFGNNGTQPPPFVITGNVLAIYTGHPNIGHALHDDLWTSLVWLHMLQDEMPLESIMNVIIYTKNAWVMDFLRLCNQTFHWYAVDVQLLLPLSSSSERITKTVCATRQMYLNGFLRDLKKMGTKSRMKQIQRELRWVALKDNDNKTLENRKEHIVIYTRQDSDTRTLVQVKDIVLLFDTDKYNISIVQAMPVTFDQQVQLFSSVDLFIAPNGGWNPNTLWMHDEACLIELHLYKIDSWIAMFGLGGLFKEGHFITVTGDYHPLNETIVTRPSRIGGDDNFSGSRVAPDIQKALKEANSACARFLK